MYLLPKIYKRFYDVPGRPIISNGGTATQKVPEFFDYHFKLVMTVGKFYFGDTGHFLQKLRQLSTLTCNAILVTADVVNLYPSIPHGVGLEAFFTKLEKRKQKIVPSADLVEMAKFVLKNNYFELDSQVRHQISGTAGELSLLFRMDVFLWTSLKRNFLIKKLINRCYGSDTLMISSLSGLREKINLKDF